MFDWSYCRICLFVFNVVCFIMHRNLTNKYKLWICNPLHFFSAASPSEVNEFLQSKQAQDQVINAFCNAMCPAEFHLLVKRCMFSFRKPAFGFA